MSIRITTMSENTASRMGLLGEWGLSILIETSGQRILFDTGRSFSAAYNAIEMGIDLTQISKIVFSHGHLDHTGGLLPILKLIRKPIEVVAHPDIWQSKYSTLSGRLRRYCGVPFSREIAEGLGASFKLTGAPLWLSKNVVTSGEIPMTTKYEEIDSGLYVKEKDKFKLDPLRDDQALFIRSEKGLIIILGCAHRGAINTIRHAQELTGVEDVYAIIGGTHLMAASPLRMDFTIAELQRLNIQRLGVSHCTGMAASALLAQTFGERFFFNNAGTCSNF
ncbi:MAG: MBL fold metallo-hydrolase [Dehalococcoidia bacterium]|nr:MBL fold metallo-hydrolase [Dehalococcoidia bacterium]